MPRLAGWLLLPAIGHAVRKADLGESENYRTRCTLLAFPFTIAHTRTYSKPETSKLESIRETTEKDYWGWKDEW